MYPVPANKTLIDPIGKYIYIGEAASDALTSDLVWKIKRLTVYGNDVVETVSASGNDSIDKSWDLRATYFVESTIPAPIPSSVNVNVVGGGTSPKGLNVGGLITLVTLNSTTWTALPLTPLAKRNAMAVQNNSGKDILLNYSASAPINVGMVILDGSERNYDISPEIVLYGACASGTCSVIVEQIA